MSIQNVTMTLGPGREVIVETGKMALLAGGAVTVRQGDTIVHVAACSSDPRPGLGFFPLQVDYRERFSAAGKFPGGYFKREGRPSEKEILTSRMTDRPLRPLFPKGFIDDVQIMAFVMSADGENEADVLCMLGASAALMVSDVPFDGPTGTVRVGRVDGQFVANPTHSEMENSDLDLVYSGLAGKVIMIEGRAKEVSEEDMRDALAFADGIVTQQCALLQELADRVQKPKKPINLHLPAPEVVTAVREYALTDDRLRNAMLVSDKSGRKAALKAFRAEMEAALGPRFADADESPAWGKALDEISEELVRALALEGIRIDGRALDEVREVECEVGLLPRTHGSALFRRGDTQAIVITTLGAEGDSQTQDVITGGVDSKSFYLHYNFPNFSVGETGRIAGPGRREIGHGALAERCVAQTMPEEFPYTVRCVSDILGSNGSSSMASVCGASLSLMDAGVPVSDSVVGISVGLVTGDDGRCVYLTDILGDEDHFGDMDFKVASTPTGITGFQLDLKIAGVTVDQMYEAMLKNKAARDQIRATMDACIAKPREEMSEYAPRIFSMQINPERIGALIGPGGKVIREITSTTGATIDVEDDGTVNIFALNGPMMEAARTRVRAVTAEPEVGEIYRGTVRTVKEFGAFVEILPGTDGLVHISELADYRVDKVEDICNVGDAVTVKLIDIDDRGRLRLSRRAALDEME